MTSVKVGVILVAVVVASFWSEVGIVSVSSIKVGIVSLLAVEVGVVVVGVASF